MTPTYRISALNNYISITSDDLDDFEGLIAPSKEVRIVTLPDDDQVFEFWNLDGRNTMWNRLKLNQILDGNGNPFTLLDWTLFYTVNTSQYGMTSGGGGATEATLSALNTKIPTQGQKTMALSTPVVLASDQSSIPVTQSGPWSVAPANVANTTPWLVTALSSAPVIVSDIASAAITTTTTTANITPSFGSSYEVNIPVTAVSGTNPTLDVSIEESDNNGTNWYTVYQFPRITATGIYRSPKMPLTGNRVRYVQTVGGSSPSFTRSTNRLQSSDNNVPQTRQLIDRTIVLTTLNSTTPSLNIQNCSNAQLVVNIGSALAAATLQLQGSDDDGASWYNIGSTLLSVASSTVQLTVNSINSQLIRAIVTSAGTTVTAGYVLIKGFK